MKRLILLLMISGGLVALQACGGAETKVDPEAGSEFDTTNMSDNAGRPAEETVTTAPSRDTPGTSGAEEKHKILRNIDKHLVSTQSASDRISVENTLADVSFQRVIVEVDELDAAGKITRTNFYQLINLEPGSTKVVKITAPNASAKVNLQIVKAKSDQLTGGEMILVGERYVEQ